MHIFKDATDREWEVVINVGQAKLVKSLLGENLYSLVEEEGRRFADLTSDPIRMIDILYVLCRDKCAALGMSDIDFGHLFDGDTLEGASAALIEEIIDFFPKPARASLRQLMKTGKALSERLLAAANKEMAELDLDKEAADIAKRLLDRNSKFSSGKWQDRSESTPTPELSAN